MPRREIEVDYSDGDDHVGEEAAQDKGEESEQSFVGSLSEASDHIAGIDDTSSHVEDPIRIQAAQAAKPGPNKKPPAKEKGQESDNESETFHVSSSEGGSEESGESDKNDDDDYEEEGTSEPDDDDEEEDYGVTTSKKRKTPSKARSGARRQRKTPAKKSVAKKTPAKKAPAKKVSAKAAKAPPKSKPQRRRAKIEERGASSEEEESGEYDEAPRRTRGVRSACGPRKSPRRKVKARGTYKDVGSSGEDSNNFENDPSEEESGSEQRKRTKQKKPTRKKGRPTRAAARSRGGKPASYKDVGSSGEESESEDDGASQNEQDESEGSEEAPKRKQSAASKGRPSRASAAKATARLAQMRYKQEKEDAEEEVDYEQVEEAKPRTRKKRKINSDEEDFKIDEEDEKDNEEEDAELGDGAKSSGEESFLKGVAGVASVPSDTQAGNADSDFGDDEVSEDGSVKGRATGRRRGQSGLNGEQLAGKAPAPAPAPEIYHSSSEDDEAEIEPTPTKARLSQEERTKPASRRRKMAQAYVCPSKYDAITEDPLPLIHVCCVSPDGNSRQCFSLETIHKIATISKHPEYRTNLSNQQQLTFLQPPHFRSAMSDELLDQIASRFGRQALDLNGDFYNRKKEARSVGVGSSDDDDDDNEGGENEYQVNFTRNHTSTETFNTAWKMYNMKTMGNQDVYPCPLCYTVAHHCIDSTCGNDDQIPLPAEFKYDPMKVLGSPDDENFEVAAGFCFTTIAKVKEHLRRVHNCNTVRIDSAVFFRYRVRATDGLLQRHLARSRKMSPGAMKKYWYEGHSEEFIYLLYQMQKRREADIGNNNNDDHESADPSIAFCESFQDKALDLWERICAPFTVGKEDMADFLADGEEEEEEDDGEPHHVFDREGAAAEQQDDEELARYYAEKAAKREDDDESSDHYAEDENEEDYESADTSESEEDEWVAERTKRKKKYSTSVHKNGRTKASNGRRRSARKQSKSNTDSSDDMNGDEEEHAATSKRAIFEDSDSD